MIDFEAKFYKTDGEDTIDWGTLEPEFLMMGNFWRKREDGIGILDAKGEHLGVLKPTNPNEDKQHLLLKHFEEAYEDRKYEGKWSYIVAVPNYWGKGKTLSEAVDNCLAECKTQNHRQNLGKGSIRAFLGKDMYTTEYGGIGGDEMKELPEEEVRTAWGDGLYELVTTELASLQESMNQFRVKIRGWDNIAAEIEDEVVGSIRKEFPENYDIEGTYPPKPRLKVPAYIIECDTEKLKTWYLNAKATCACGGHRKGQRNDELVELYTQELKDRGEELPQGEGQFNGEGSS